MAKQYDKIIKENLEAIFIPLTKKLLNLEFDETEEIADDLHITLETLPDCLKRVRQKNKNEYIVHIEFQAANERYMAERMLLYYSMLLKKYGLPVHQQVFYLGKSSLSMKSEIIQDNLNFRYNFLNLSTVPYFQFLNTNRPEEMILAILGDFQNNTSVDVAKQILQHIDNLKIGNELKLRAVKQLEIISGLRNLQPLIAELIPNIMALNYDIRKDLRFKQGLEKGLEKGKIEARKEIIISMLKKAKLSHNEIAELVGVSLKDVLEIAKSIGL
jgi:predicted transposase/invertase (TIGR01784 family)